MTSTPARSWLPSCSTKRRLAKGAAHPDRFLVAQVGLAVLTVLSTRLVLPCVRRMRQDSVSLSQAFFDTLPLGFVRCPGCSVPIETLVDDNISTLGSVQEMPRGATLDTVGAEKHKGCNRFRCLQCSTEFCAGCSTLPYHYGFDCEAWSAHATAQRCRFCGDVAVSDACCGNEECRRFLSFACKAPLSCGHLSCGVEGEELPCLEEECTLSTAITATADDWCMICYVAPLRGAPCVLLGCKHVFHAECLKARIVNGRPG